MRTFQYKYIKYLYWLYRELHYSSKRLLKNHTTYATWNNAVCEISKKFLISLKSMIDCNFKQIYIILS